MPHSATSEGALVALEGTFNFRDLGGYQTADGRVVARRRLFRGDSLHRLSESDLEILGRLAVRTVVDFRSVAEASTHPDRLPPGARLVRLSPHAAMAALASGDAQDDASKVRALVEKASTPEGERRLRERQDAMAEQMRRLVTTPEGIAAFSRFLALAAEAGADPLVFHCRGGKDRTGWAAALLLMLLGVPKDAVMRDYLATGVHNASRNAARMAEYRGLTSSSAVLEFLESLMVVKASCLDAALEEMGRLGGIDVYVADVLDIPRQVVDTLREKYLHR